MEVHLTYPQFRISKDGFAYTKFNKPLKINEFITINGLKINGIKQKTKRIPYKNFIWEGLNGPIPEGKYIVGDPKKGIDGLTLKNKKEIKITMNNKERAYYSISDAARDLNIKYDTIRYRIETGKPLVF